MARKMKDSGIEWIGEIPEGWSKNKVIRLFDIIGSGTTPKNITSDFPVVNWIQSGDITGSFMPTCKNVISANLLSQYSALKVYPAPFIIIAMYGASVGNASISLIDGCVNQRNGSITNRSTIHSNDYSPRQLPTKYHRR